MLDSRQLASLFTINFPDPRPDIFTYADFDLQALCRQASTLRQGASCACNPDQRPASGSFNWAVFISFEDGVRWVFRSPHERAFMPMEMGMKLLASEAATLRYLKAHSDIPVPEVYNYRRLSQPDLDTRNKVSQLGAITWKVSQLRLDNIGSPFEDEGAFQVKECLSRGHVLPGRYDLDVPRGPFTSQMDFHNSLVSAFSEHAEILPLSHHCFAAPVHSRDAYQFHSKYKRAVDLWNDYVTVGCRTDSSDNRLDHIIAGGALRDIVRRLELPAVNPGSFPLCHADLRVNNIHVDDDYNITCIIDWAFASSFGDEISSELQAPFIDGFIAAISASFEKTLIHRYREALDQGQFSWRLTRLLNLDSTDDYNLFATVWDFAHGPSKDLGQYFLQQRRSPHFTQLHGKVQQENQPVSKTKKDEQDYFQNKTLRNTIAKKLTLISEWKTQCATTDPPSLRERMFVADSKLWKWILRFMQDCEDMSGYTPASSIS
ncbi:hypothetical protein BJX99DRAFT_266924 [Aspergillus californicus]